MVYIKKWPEFQSQCLQLYQKAPEKTRYLIKAQPSQTWLVLKVTDDETCLKFRTRSSIILNRFESFTKDLTALMAGIPMPSVAVAQAAKDVEAKQEAKAETAAGAKQGVNAGAGAGAAAGSGSGGGGGKKKKKKGGKK